MSTMEKLLGLLTGKRAKTKQQDKQQSGEPFKTRVQPIEGTAFACVEKNDNEYVIVFGQNMITDKTFKDKFEATTWLRKTEWNAILNVIGIYVDFALKNEKSSNKN